MPPALGQLQTGSLSAQAFRVIRDAIFSGQIQPGEPLRELYLARSLQVSQATVREALVQLESAGLVVRHPNRRTTVTSFTRDEVADRLQLRILLEEQAAVKAAARASKADLASMSVQAAAIAAALEAGDDYARVQADIGFHRGIWELSGSAILAQTLDHLTTPLFAFLAVIQQAAPKTRKPGRSHERIVKVLRSTDEARIRAEIRAHVETSYSDFLTSPETTLDAFVCARKDAPADADR